MDAIKSNNGKFIFRTSEKDYDIVFDLNPYVADFGDIIGSSEDDEDGIGNTFRSVTEQELTDFDKLVGVDKNSGQLVGITFTSQIVVAKLRNGDKSFNAMMAEGDIHEVIHSLGVGHDELGFHGYEINPRVIQGIFDYATQQNSNNLGHSITSGNSFATHYSRINNSPFVSINSIIVWVSKGTINLKGTILNK